MARFRVRGYGIRAWQIADVIRRRGKLSTDSTVLNCLAEGMSIATREIRAYAGTLCRCSFFIP